MALSASFYSCIKKLGHPLREIRERSLLLLIAKSGLGLGLEDELAGTRELLEMLLQWFHTQQPTLQREALEFLLSTVKTKSGAHAAKEYGISELISNLNAIQHKLVGDAQDVYNDLIESLQFMYTVNSEENVGVPGLQIPSISSNSDSEIGLNNNFYNMSFESLKKSELSSQHIQPFYGRQSTSLLRVMLFPWAQLCGSDRKTLILVEDALRLLKSTNRCCRFVCDVLVRDFPTEVFLNRPIIVKNLFRLIRENKSMVEPLGALLCITRSLRTRLRQLTSLDLAHVPKILQNITSKNDETHLELMEIVGDMAKELPTDDAGILPLKQLPAPYFVLDCMHVILTAMTRSIVFGKEHEHDILLSASELNICVELVEETIGFLQECVDKEFWQSEHNTKTYRDIAHKSCMSMRMLADVLAKYNEFILEDIKYRSVWFRLVKCAVRFLDWSHNSNLPPICFVNVISCARLDPALSLFYPELATTISTTLQNGKLQEYENKKIYTDLRKLFASMEASIIIFKDKDLCHTKSILAIIKKSLPALGLHANNGQYIKNVANILLKSVVEWELEDSDWNIVKNIALSLMSHKLFSISEIFYETMLEVLKEFFVDDNMHVADEKMLTLFCDVGVLTEICCHGLSSKSHTVSLISNEMLILLLRGRLLVTERCWWRLLAAMLPIMPLLHAKADHDTPLGQAICKSLEVDIADCMGIPRSEVLMGLSRLLFVRCPAVQLDAALSICSLIDDPKYLPPKETLRADILMSALRGVEPEHLNISTLTPANAIQTAGLLQILDVLKQDLNLDDDNMGLTKETVSRSLCLEPSLRRSTLQQLSVLMQNSDMHEKFVECDGLKIIMALMRLSLLVEDYLAFPECAISCVSILNSVCYHSRHVLAKISDLPAFLIRVILIFPANEPLVLMSAQVLSVLGWAGFVLQELDCDHKRVLALPLSVVANVCLPFPVECYWETSPNTEHSPLEYLQTKEALQRAIRVRWSYVWNGFPQLLYEPSSPPGSRTMVMTEEDQKLLQTACPLFSSCRALLALQNATTHKQVYEAIGLLENYCHLLARSYVNLPDYASLPWFTTMARYLTAAPSSPKDVALLTNLLKFIITYLKVMPNPVDINLRDWVIKSFLESDNSMILLLSKDTLFPQQTVSESVEVARLQVHIVKVLCMCVVALEQEKHFDSTKLESLMKILLVCLKKIDLKDFHVLGYLNEIVKCIRYITHSKHCELSTETIELSMREISVVLRTGSSGGCKGLACRLDAMVTLLRLLTLAKTLRIPVQHWGDIWSGGVMTSVVQCGEGPRAELRAAAIQLMTILAMYPQLLPQLLQAVPHGSIAKYAAAIFAERSEANIVRSAAANLLTAISSRLSSHADYMTKLERYYKTKESKVPETGVHIHAYDESMSVDEAKDVYENDILEQLKENDFLEHCLEILMDFCKEKHYKQCIEPNVPVSILERLEELEVRASKHGDVQISPKMTFVSECVPPTTQLVVALADTLHNVVVFNRCPIQFWNEKGLFRLLFRCSYWGDASCDGSLDVRSSVCRALCRASAISSRVRMTLASTKDCLLSLLCSLEHITIDYPECQQAMCQSFLFLGTLLSETCVSDSIWMTLRQGEADHFFHMVILCLQNNNLELEKSTMFFLTQLLQSISSRKHVVPTEESLIAFFDNIKVLQEPESINSCERMGHFENCYPHYVSQELCNVLIRLYIGTSSDETKTDMGQDEYWLNISSCMATVLAVSARARAHATTISDFHETVLSTLSRIRDQLSFIDKPVHVIRNANNNPTFVTLQWTLILIDSMMKDCVEAKNTFADNKLAVTLVRLWPHCMMTEPLREAVVHLLHTFTNDCPKAWAAMCTCVSGQTLMGAVCTLAVREAALLSRPHGPARLVLALHTAAHCMPHARAGSLVLQSDILSCIYKIVSSGGELAATAWSRLAASAAARADGAARVLALRPLPANLLPALANAAHTRRLSILGEAEALELISGALLSASPTHVLTAARAVWALAANNHKAKLTLRNAGVSAALRTALERYKQSTLDVTAERTLQLLMYTDSLLRDI